MAFDRKTAEKWFEKFSTSTVIRVFNFIRTSTFRVERLFWVALLVGFSSLTIWSVTQTIQTFLSEPTVSRVTYFRNRTSGVGFHFSEAFIALQMDHESLRKLYEAKIDEVIADLVNSEKDFVEILERKLTIVHESEDRRAASYNSFTENRSATDQAVSHFDSYHSFQSENLQIFTRNEIALLAMTTSLLARQIDVEMNPYPLHSHLQPESIKKLLDAYVRKRTDFSKLFAVVAEMTCVLLQLRVVIVHFEEAMGRYTEIKGYNFCKHLPSMFYFGYFNGRIEVIAYRMGFEFVFNNEFDSVVVSAHTESLYEGFADELKTIYFSLGDTESAPLKLEFNVRQTFEFSIDTVSVAANLRRKECDENDSSMECASWCRVESVKKACKCEPLYTRFISKFPNLPERLESCASSVLARERLFTDAKCRAALAVAYDPKASNCSKSCPPNCEVTLCSSLVRSGLTRWENANASTVVVLKTNKFDYGKVEEQLTMTAMTLVAAIGGNLSLYLGASFLALIHIVVFLVKLPFEHTHNYTVDVAPHASYVPGVNSDLETRIMEKLSIMRQELIDLLDQRCPSGQKRQDHHRHGAQAT